MPNLITRKQNNNNLSPIHSLQGKIGKLFDNFFEDFAENSLTENFGLDKNFHPKVNISETDKEYLLEADLAGLNKEDVKEDVKIDYKDNMLLISADKKEEKEESNKNYHRREYFCGSFYRSFEIPSGVEQKDITAEMKNGVLKIVLPKGKETLSKSGRISIK